MSIDDRQLRYFVDVATFRSINKAAEHRNIAQPALSRRMRQLEYDLDTELFKRLPTGIELTGAGKRLLVRAASLIGEFDRIREAVAESGKAPGTHLRLGMPPGVSLMLLDRLVSEVYRGLDDVILQIKEGDTQTLLAQVLEGDLEIAVVSKRDFSPAFEVRPYYSEPLFFAVHSDYPQAPSEVPLPFAVPDADEPFFQIAYRALKELGRAPEIHMRLATIESIKRLVDRAQACTLGPYCALTTELLENKWNMTPVPNLLLDRFIVWRRGEGENALIEHVQRILQDVIKLAAQKGAGHHLVLPPQTSS